MKILVAPSVESYTDVECPTCKAVLDAPCAGYKQNRVHPARKALVHRVWVQMYVDLSAKLTKLSLI